jgi:hypothetical protein
MQTSTSLRLTARFQRIFVVLVLQTVVFCLLNTDLIRAFYAGALPSFAECKQLTLFYCFRNQFTGA